MAGVAHSCLPHTLQPHARLYVVVEIKGEHDPSRHNAVCFQLALCRASCMVGFSHRSCALAIEARMMPSCWKHFWCLAIDIETWTGTPGSFVFEAESILE
jgi:hypothetical protein